MSGRNPTVSNALLHKLNERDAAAYYGSRSKRQSAEIASWSFVAGTVLLTLYGVLVVFGVIG